MITIFTDGSCSPGGIASYGWVAYEGRTKLAEEKGIIVRGAGATSNMAEYGAILRALTWAHKHHRAREITVHADSELVVRQVTGTYKVNAFNLIPYHREVMRLLQNLRVTCVWIPREQNTEADRLARSVWDTPKGKTPAPSVSQQREYRRTPEADTRTYTIPDVRAIAQSDKAVLIDLGDKREWFPFSFIDTESPVKVKGQSGALIIPEWLARRKKLLRGGAHAA